MKKRVNDFSFLDHLEELRARLIKCLGAIALAAMVVYPFIDTILKFVSRPVGKLVFTYPSDAFVARLQLTFLGGIFLSFPVVVYQIWRFVGIALTEEERKWAVLFGPVSLILFFLGGLFAYFVVAPFSLQFLLNFSSDVMVPMITVNNYISYIGSLILGCALTFELPVVLLFLTKIGIATPAFLIQKRSYALVGFLIVSAVLTPPDVISMLLMAAPLIILYEIGILFSKMAFKKISYEVPSSP